MNKELEAMMKARQKKLGVNEEQPKQPQFKPQIKIQKSNTTGFNEARKLLEANLFKKNAPKQETVVVPKQEIKGNSENMKNARAMLEAKLNFGGNTGSSSNTGGGLLPPPSLNLPNTLPPPPTLPGLPNLPPPPTLPNIVNLPPPPTLPNIVNLPPPPTLPNVPILPPPPSLPNTLPQNPILPPPPSLNIPSNLPPPNLPPPPVFIPTQPKVQPQKPIQQSTTRPVNIKDSTFSQQSDNSSTISEEQFRAFENKVTKQKSVQKKKGIFSNQPMIRSSNKTGQSPSIPSQTPPPYQNPMQSSKTQSPYHQPSSSGVSPPPVINPQQNIQPSETKLPPKPPVDNDKKKRIFQQKQASISYEFFGKDLSGFLKREFLKTSDIMTYIDKKLPQQKKTNPQQRPRYCFPSMFKDTKGQKVTQITPQETLYLDTKTLNLSGPFLVNNLNTIKPHTQSRQTFAAKLKTYDIQKDPQKLNLRVIRQLADTIPQVQWLEPNIARIFSCQRKCDALIKQKSIIEEFTKCEQIKQLRYQLQKLIEKYCKYPEDCTDEFDRIQRIISQIKDLE